MKTKGLTVLALVFALACGASSKAQPLETVPKVDVNRYLGTWYEIARYPNSFQKNCYKSTANYSLKDNGDIKVVNACFKGGPDGELDSAEGIAWVVDKTTNAKLKVRFFWPFSGNYWIINLGDNYEYAVVGEPDREYLWILSRTPKLDESQYQALLSRIHEKGYDTSKLIMQ